MPEGTVLPSSTLDYQKTNNNTSVSRRTNLQVLVTSWNAKLIGASCLFIEPTASIIYQEHINEYLFRGVGLCLPQ